MTVKRIVANISAQRIEDADAFYRDLLGLEPVMDHGWIRTYSSAEMTSVQISIATEGGSGTSVPDMSIEVDNLEEVLARARSANYDIFYGPADEPWGVRRFYVRDPFGKIVNILAHIE